MTWQLGELTSLHWRHFGEEWLLFDQGTGQTVLLDAISAASLMALEPGPLSIEALERQVASDLDLPDLAERHLAFKDNLQFLAELNLIRSSVSA